MCIFLEQEVEIYHRTLRKCEGVSLLHGNTKLLLNIIQLVLWCFFSSLLSLVSVGFEYESCLSVVLWERRRSTLQGFEVDSSHMGSWTLEKHHVLDLQNGEKFLRFVPLALASCFR